MKKNEKNTQLFWRTADTNSEGGQEENMIAGGQVDSRVKKTASILEWKTDSCSRSSGRSTCEAAVDATVTKQTQGLSDEQAVQFLEKIRPLRKEIDRICYRFDQKENNSSRLGKNSNTAGCVAKILEKPADARAGNPDAGEVRSYRREMFRDTGRKAGPSASRPQPPIKIGDTFEGVTLMVGTSLQDLFAAARRAVKPPVPQPQPQPQPQPGAVAGAAKGFLELWDGVAKGGYSSVEKRGVLLPVARKVKPDLTDEAFEAAMDDEAKGTELRAHLAQQIEGMESGEITELKKTLEKNAEEVKPKNEFAVTLLPPLFHSGQHPGHEEGDSFEKWGFEGIVSLGGKIHTGARCEVSWGAKGSTSRNSGIPFDERYAVDPGAVPEHGYAITATGEARVQCAILEGGKTFFVTGRGGVIKPNPAYAPGLTVGPGLLWKPLEELKISGEVLVSPAIVDIGRGDIGGGAAAAVPVQIKLEKSIGEVAEISGQGGVIFSDAGENNAKKNVAEYISPSLQADLTLKAEDFKLTLGGNMKGNFNREGGPDSTTAGASLGAFYKRFGLAYEYARTVVGGEVAPTSGVCGISVCPSSSPTAASRNPQHTVTASYELITDRLKILGGIQSGENSLVRENDFGATTEPNGSSLNAFAGVGGKF